MNRWMRAIAAAALLASAAGAVQAGVTVTFTDPDTYVAMPQAADERERILKDLDEHFARLGAKLPAGTDLKVDVLELRMAGRVLPNFRGGDDVRLIKGGADWPSMRLHYALTRDGKVVAQGEERLSNMDYLARANRAGAEQTNIYEKQMIDDWFTARIINGKLAAR